ncbi:MAG: glutathione S-transferase family protein [Alphaproteobacteria bacterium]|nr:glutathione S-transferase family protein [Alphaproteobacteria bacterium]
MKLYEFKAAPNPRRVRVYLAEKNFSIPCEQVNLFKGEHKAPGFLAKNPFARVPVLELDDGRTLAESMAICRYIEELKPSPPLFGRNREEHAFVEMWQRSAEYELLFPIANAFRHGTEFGKGLESNQNTAWAETCRARALAAMKILDAELGGRQFVAGNEFTVADITTMVSIDFGAATGAVKVPDDMKHLKRWHGEVSARPSAKA